MSVNVSLLMRVIQKYSSEESDSRQRYINFMDFLRSFGGGSNSDSTSKEAADEGYSKASKALGEWFERNLKKYLPVNFFSKKQQDRYPWRKDVFSNLYKTLHDKLRYALLSRVSQKSNQQLGRRLETDEFGISRDSVSIKVMDLLEKMQNDPEFVRKAIAGVFSEKKKDEKPQAEAPESKGRYKKVEPGLAESMFVPRVTDDLYENYKDELNSHKDTKYSNVLERAKEKGRNYIIPEDIGVEKGKIDPYAYDILNNEKKFHINIKDQKLAYDPKKKNYTWQVYFNIPELTRKLKNLYGDVLFSIKLPSEMRNPTPGEDIPVTVRSATDRKKGKGSLLVRFEDTYKNWTKDVEESLRTEGFTRKSQFNKFIDRLSSVFAQNWMKGKNLEEMIEDLGREGGQLFFHGQGFGSANQLSDVVDQMSGKSMTRRELKDKREMGQFKKREQIVEEMINEAIEASGEKVSRFFESIDKEEADRLKQSILRSGSFLNASRLIRALKEGNIKIGWRNLSNVKELVSYALSLILNPKQEPGKSGWSAVFRDRLKKVLEKNPELFELSRLITLKDMLMKKGKKGKELSLSLISISQDKNKLDKIVSPQDVTSAIEEFIKKSGLVITSDISSKIYDVIDKKLRKSPNFQKFWGRRRAWKDYARKQIEPKIERILEGDDPVPRYVVSKMDSDLKNDILVEEVDDKGEKTKRKKVNISELPLDKMDDISSFVELLTEYYEGGLLKQFYRKTEASYGSFIIEQFMNNKS